MNQLKEVITLILLVVVIYFKNLTINTKINKVEKKMTDHA